ncbi:MAG TPA: hypothetical protein VGQ31_11770 [Candidatus Limnocylindrales bacterium]|nr:hypothetical protein [Candidatus Limnocylindrales bacterium]
MEPVTLVDDYLGRLEAAAGAIEGDRRAELVADVREHIDLALADRGTADEATVRMVLDRLGSPAEIVAAEMGEERSAVGLEAQEPSTTDPAGRKPLSVEARALLLLTVGAVILPFIGPLLGLWFVSGSTRWSLAQKRTATLIVLALLTLPAVLLLPAVAAGELTWVFSSGGFLVPFVPLAGFLAASYLVISTSVVIAISRRT